MVSVPFTAVTMVAANFEARSLSALLPPMFRTPSRTEIRAPTRTPSTLSSSGGERGAGVDKHQIAPLAIIVLACLLVTLAVFQKSEQIVFASLLSFAGGLVTGAFALLNSGRTQLPDGNTTSTLTQVTVPPPAVVAPEDVK